MRKLFARIKTSFKHPLTWGVLAIILLVIFGGSMAAYEYHGTPQFCGNTCHLMQSYVDTWTDVEETNYLAASHAKNGVTCLDCHEKTLDQQVSELVTYIHQDYRDPLRRRQFDNSMCLNCHMEENQHQSYEAIATRTADWLVEYNRNPHDPPHYEDLECSTCHRSHRESEILCADCHNMPNLGNGWAVEPTLDAPVP